MADWENKFEREMEAAIQRGLEQGGNVIVNKAELAALVAEKDRLAAEVASLRLTLGGRTFSAEVPEPVGCPAPGACQTVAEIQRLRAALWRIAESGPPAEYERIARDALVAVLDQKARTPYS